jgi:hypothetical protein
MFVASVAERHLKDYVIAKRQNTFPVLFVMRHSVFILFFRPSGHKITPPRLYDSLPQLYPAPRSAATKKDARQKRGSVLRGYTIDNY